MNQSMSRENIEEAIHIVELFQKLCEDDKKQCLIYISALVDKEMMQEK